MKEITPESSAMLASLYAQAKESGKTHAEVVTWIVSEVLSMAQPQDERAEEEQAKQQTRPHDPATGPVPQQWQAPTNGFFRRDGRFVPNATWKPAQRSVETPRECAVPDVASMLTYTRNNGSHLGVAKDGRVRDLCATGPIGQPWQPPKETED